MVAAPMPKILVRLCSPGHPFKYFGATIHPHRRANQHKAGSITSLLMALVVEVGRYAFHNAEGVPKFDIKPYTVCHTASEENYPLAEELLC